MAKSSEGRRRDILAEIRSQRARLAATDRYSQYVLRVHKACGLIELEKVEGINRDDLAEWLKYIPIGIVASMQGYFRLAIRDLIDSGSPFRENAAKLAVDKLDLSAVLAIGAREVSAGELIAHQLRMNSVDDICAHMTTLVGSDFRKAVVAMNPVSSAASHDEIADILFPPLDALFVNRHIFCHELALDAPYTKHDALFAATYSDFFVNWTEALVQKCLSDSKAS